MVRHVSFKTSGDLKAFIIREVPKSMYYSVAYYNEPTYKMQEKGLKGADLVFDIDCDDINLKCKKEHDIWTCSGCRNIGTGNRPKKCNSCSGEQINQLNLSCEKCLDASKIEIIKLLDLLYEDFGLSSNEIKTYFSGNMGYHLAIEGSILEEVNQMGRIEISDYVTGKTLKPETIGFFQGISPEKILSHLPTINDVGRRKRVIKIFSKKLKIKYSEDNDSEFKKEIINVFYRKKYHKFNKLFFDTLINMNPNIDTTVTTDIHRIFRLPGTLHGDTGLIKAKVENIDKFNPLEDAVVFGEDLVEIYVEAVPKFKLRGQVFGKYRSQKVKLPLMAAVYLLSLNVAKLV